MSEINRSLIILRQKQPFLDWTRTLDDHGIDFTLEELSQDAIAYLVPEIWDDSEQEALLESYYDILFDEQLNGWCMDEADWPKERDLKMFLDWFEVEIHSLVIDLCDKPIRRIEAS